jgi:hypothetical protein
MISPAHARAASKRLPDWRTGGAVLRAPGNSVYGEEAFRIERPFQLTGLGVIAILGSHEPPCP